jgi:hypothetical protein
MTTRQTRKSEMFSDSVACGHMCYPVISLSILRDRRFLSRDSNRIQAINVKSVSYSCSVISTARNQIKEGTDARTSNWSG